MFPLVKEGNKGRFGLREAMMKVILRPGKTDGGIIVVDQFDPPAEAIASAIAGRLVLD